jgi:hypothetical protein
METIVIGLFFVVVVGLRVWATRAYSEFYDALPDADQKAILRRAMQSGI